MASLKFTSSKSMSLLSVDASGNPIILQGLASGPHKVTLELVKANHQPIDKGSITFAVPENNASERLP
jgi:hypothetical protein